MKARAFVLFRGLDCDMRLLKTKTKHLFNENSHYNKHETCIGMNEQIEKSWPEKGKKEEAQVECKQWR